MIPQASFQERVRAYSNWQHAQQMLTKKREALVKLELASKNEKLPQAQEEVKEVRKLVILHCNRNLIEGVMTVV